MKTEKMSLEKMKNVLGDLLSRDEMKEIMAGSGGGGQICGICVNEVTSQGYYCYTGGTFGGCNCAGVGGPCH